MVKGLQDLVRATWSKWHLRGADGDDIYQFVRRRPAWQPSVLATRLVVTPGDAVKLLSLFGFVESEPGYFEQLESRDLSDVQERVRRVFGGPWDPAVGACREEVVCPADRAE